MCVTIFSVWDWARFILSHRLFRLEGRIAVNDGILFLKGTHATACLHHINLKDVHLPLFRDYMQESQEIVLYPLLLLVR